MKVVDKIDMYVIEGVMGKKEFKNVVNRILDQYEERSQARFWDKWDEAVDGGGQLYLEDILWRLFDDRKLWNQFVKEWTGMGKTI